MTLPTAPKIKAKKLGVLIRDARQATCLSVEDCASALGVSPETITAFELGDQAPSLPELELLAYQFKVPLEHFWGDGAHLLGSKDQEKPVDPKALMALRQKIIGVLLRKARLEKELTLDQLAENTGVDAARLQSYEMGEMAVPLPELELLAVEIGAPVKAFYDQRGPVGSWLVQQRFMNEFMELSPEMQAFVCKPINRPYIEVAQRLSEMSADKLRNIAEVLLDITL
jgi:transcriptional regulator with XRE-family HTH domain